MLRGVYTGWDGTVFWKLFCSFEYGFVFYGDDCLACGFLLLLSTAGKDYEKIYAAFFIYSLKMSWLCRENIFSLRPGLNGIYAYVRKLRSWWNKERREKHQACRRLCVRISFVTAHLLEKVWNSGKSCKKLALLWLFHLLRLSSDIGIKRTYFRDRFIPHLRSSILPTLYCIDLSSQAKIFT